MGISTDPADRKQPSALMADINETRVSNLRANTYKDWHEMLPFSLHGYRTTANKNIKKIVKKMTVTYKYWHEMLPFSLHGYRTSARTSTGATPYLLVYGMEAVLPIEVQIPSLRIMKDAV